MKRVVIYGTGREFKRLFSGGDMYEWMKGNDISIIGVANNNPDKFGKLVYIFESAYEITYIGDFKQDSYDYILITSPYYFEEIKEFLVSLGVYENKIITVKGFIDQIINEASECKYGISIAAIVKDEAAYIEEWIQFHILMGIDHFYIYDNESSDGTAEILKEYEKIGLVTYIFWPGKAQQIPAYSNAINRFKNDSIYIAFIDVDEFLFSVSGNKIIDEVNQVLNQYEKVRAREEGIAAGIGVNWRTYGTSFYSSQSSELVIKRFMFRRKANKEFNTYIKSICNPRAVVRMEIHYADYVPGCCCISENGSEITKSFFRDGRCKTLRINHYMSKSEEEFVKRKRKGDALGYKLKQSEEYIKSALGSYQTVYNEHYDPVLVKYGNLVEKAIKKYRSEFT